MKKIFSLMLTIALVFAMSVLSVSAEETTLDDVATNNSTTGDINVNIAGSEDLQTVYSVDVAWDSLDFTYNFTGSDVWDPEDHTYSSTGAGGWANASATITVTNHSNATIRAKASFAGGASSLTRNDVTATLSNPSFTVNSAVGTAPDAAPNGTFTCTVSGVPSITSNFTVGTITISFEPAT